jgi:hypothetical protein
LSPSFLVILREPFALPVILTLNLSHFVILREHSDRRILLRVNSVKGKNLTAQDKLRDRRISSPSKGED